MQCQPEEIGSFVYKIYKVKKLVIVFVLVLVENMNAQIDNAPYSALLRQYVTSDGLVDYKGLLTKREELGRYLTQLENTDTAQLKSRNQKLAFWINAYNAFTLALILDHYPVQSITDLHPVFYVPGLNSVWHYKFFSIDGNEMNLDHIEHQILRKAFNEPRIHFAINCASISCPVLRNEAYNAESIELQLEEQTRKFINDSSRNEISEKTLVLSKIFSWFKSDFTKNSSLQEFIRKYSDTQFSKNPSIRFKKYNWRLNEI